MKRGRLLQPDEIHIGQKVIVVPSGDDVHRGVGLGAHPVEGCEARLTDQLHGACRRGAVHLYDLPKDEPTLAAEAPATTQPEEP